MNTRYHALTLKQIVEQINIDQFTRLCAIVEEKHGKGVRFDILSVKPYRNSKDVSLIAVSIILQNNQVKSFDVHEKI